MRVGFSLACCTAAAAAMNHSCFVKFNKKFWELLLYFV